MTIEKGETALIEDSMAAVLSALTYNDSAVFRTADPWTHQLDSLSESFDRYSPFAFVGFSPNAPRREGGYDLSQSFRFEVIFGLTSTENGVARRGDANHIGASKVRDLIIAALDDWHPGASFNCDDFHLVDELEYLDAPKKYAAGLIFAAQRLPST